MLNIAGSQREATLLAITITLVLPTVTLCEKEQSDLTYLWFNNLIKASRNISNIVSSVADKKQDFVVFAVSLWDKEQPDLTYPKKDNQI